MTPPQASEAAVGALRAFVQDVMGDWPESCGLDGFELQELAQKHGLLVPVMMQGPCGENCACLEFLSEGDFPSECFRKTTLLTGRPESDEAIAALSALPAAGGVVAEVCMDQSGCKYLCWSPGLKELPAAGTKLYTTPQPSAAEPKCGCGRPGEYESKDGPACNKYFRCKDAAVGAQGDGEPDAGSREEADLHYASLAEAALNKLRVIGPITPPEDIAIQATINRLRWYASNVMMPAALAAGKGVAEYVLALLVTGRYVTQAKVDEARRIALGCEPAHPADDDEAMVPGDADDMAEALAEISTTLGCDNTLDDILHAIAALTRQPVAGDGWRPVAEIADLPPTDQPECFLYFPALPEAIKRGGNRAIYRVGRPADFPSRAPTHYKPATPPAATPTDGGEG